MSHSILKSTQQFLNKPGQLLINGKWVNAISGKHFETFNPATGKAIAKVSHGEAADVDLAVKAARAAFDGPWRKMTASERSKVVWKIGDLIEKHADEFAELEALDNGKPKSIARVADVNLAADLFHYMAGWSTKISGKTFPISVPYAPGATFHAMTLREPIGVIGQIIPWNFPLLMAAWKLGPALAMGNTIVLKPAEQTPLSALRLGELLLEAGVPAGVVNIVTGFGDAGAAIAAHDGIDKVAFTGSTEVGKLIVAAAKGNLKKVTLELGGKNPNIIFKDTEDLQKAIDGAANAIFFNQGQVCCAGSKLLIEKEIYDDVVKGVAKFAENIKVGHGLDPATQMGPLVSAEQLETVTRYMNLGRTDGGVIVTGGTRLGNEGYFVKPTVIKDVRKGMAVVDEEIFGPVVVAQPFSSAEQVIKAGNDTSYGLAAGIWTKDLAKAHRVASAMRAGTVWVNCFNIFDAALPFGGYKQSGWGREMGQEAVDLYTETKSVVINTTPHH